jgi:hypothetical protein
MRKIRTIATTIIMLGLLAVGTAAQANVYMPSLVDIVYSPTLCSLLIFNLIFTVPVLCLIGGLEAWVLKRHQIEGSFGWLFGQMVILNAITSLVRIPTAFGLRLWPTFFIALALTVPLEALLLRGMLRRHLDLPDFHTAIACSLRMNVASYLLLGIGLAGMLYLPQLGHESAAVHTRS